MVREGQECAPETRTRAGQRQHHQKASPGTGQQPSLLPRAGLPARAGLPVGGRVLCSLNPEVWLISLLKVLIDLRFNFTF